jgi:hypothetical protein
LRCLVFVQKVKFVVVHALRMPSDMVRPVVNFWAVRLSLAMECLTLW